MGLRIKELCRERKITMAEIASRIRWTDREGEHVGINPITLSQSLNGNPTLSRLQEVADILGVEVSELFENSKADIQGCIFVNGDARIIKSREDIERILAEFR